MIATPTEVGMLVADGNEVLVCSGAGFKAGFDDDEYEETSGIQNRPWVPAEVILGIKDEKLDPAPKPTLTRSDNYYPEFDI